MDTWDRNGLTSGPTPWQIYNDDDDYDEKEEEEEEEEFGFIRYPKVYV